MNKPHICVDRTCGVKQFWVVVSRTNFDDMSRDERELRYAAEVQARVLNVMSYIKFRDNNSFDDAVGLMQDAIALRINHHVDVVHLVKKWLNGTPNALRSVTRELSAPHMVHLLSYRDNPAVRKVMP